MLFISAAVGAAVGLLVYVCLTASPREIHYIAGVDWGHSRPKTFILCPQCKKELRGTGWCPTCKVSYLVG